MPIYRRGDMFAEVNPAKTPLFFTANSCLRVNKTLVMGAGAALAAKLRFPDLDKRLGEKLQRSFAGGDYHILYDNYSGVGALQVKRNWRDPAIPTLIERSIWALDKWAREGGCPEVHYNFPGIGAGGLRRDQVRDMLSYLPDYHHIWERP